MSKEFRFAGNVYNNSCTNTSDPDTLIIGANINDNVFPTTLLGDTFHDEWYIWIQPQLLGILTIPKGKYPT